VPVILLLIGRFTVDSYLYPIIALLPLTAAMLVWQRNPYHALVLRGLMGAITALIYALLGAADVALTEALVGTLLAVLLYAVAVRSSLVVRLGGLTGDDLEEIRAQVRSLIQAHYLRLEVYLYPTPEDLEQALKEGEVQVISLTAGEKAVTHQILTPLRRLYEILNQCPQLQVTWLHSGAQLKPSQRQEETP
jgi:putative multicomponent Na+:H+ antiporter subunit B